MWYLLETIWNWLDGFIRGAIVYVSCDYCSYELNEKEIAYFSNDGLLKNMLDHPCPVKDRRHLTMISR